jgi:hypothetical protein
MSNLIILDFNMLPAAVYSPKPSIPEKIFREGYGIKRKKKSRVLYTPKCRLKPNHLYFVKLAPIQRRCNVGKGLDERIRSNLATANCPASAYVGIVSFQPRQ